MEARTTYVLKLAAIAGVYYGSAKLGLSLAFETSSVTAIWPPTGIALAALVLWGPRVWPGVALGALLANAWTGVPLVTVLGITAGNTLEAVAGAYLLRQVKFRPSLERVRDVLALIVLAGGVSTLIAATIGVGSLLVGDEVSARNFASVWRVWWLGDMGGDLLVAPTLLVAASRPSLRRLPGGRVEAVALALTVLGLGTLTLYQEVSLAYLVFPVLMWAALRFEQPGAAMASLAVAAIAVELTAQDIGSFVEENPDDSLLLAQTFTAVAAMTALLLAAVTSQRRRAETELGLIARTLQSSLLPPRLPRVPSLELAAAFRPAGERHIVGGDFYDVFQVEGARWAVVVGDVSGKGARAAAGTGLVRNTLRAVTSAERTPCATLTHLNEAFLRQRTAEEFCTVAYAHVEPSGERARIEFCTGGHPLPFVLRADGEVQPLGRPGLLLGVKRDPRLSQQDEELRPGDALLFYTDGLLDAHAPDRLLTGGDVASLLRSCAGMRAAEIVAHVESSALQPMTAPPRDDIALLALRFVPDAG